MTSDISQLMNEQVTWKGWKTTFGDLFRKGWEISIKPKYNSWTRPCHAEASREKIYIRHEENNMLGRIIKKTITDYTVGTDKKVTRDYYELDFLIQEHNSRTKHNPIYLEKDLTHDDIPQLMELILGLQEKKKVKKRPTKEIKHQAEILLLRA